MQDNSNEREVRVAESVCDYLEHMHEMGVQLFVDDEMVLPYEAARRTVREEFSYMADYVMGESGRIQQIRFDKVEN